MHRLLVGSCLLALVVSAAIHAADDEKKDEKSEGGFKALFSVAIKEFRAAKSKEEKEKVLTKHAEKFVAYVEKNPKADDALQTLLSTVSMPLPASKNGPQAKALAILTKNFAGSKELAPFMRRLGMMENEGVTTFLKAVVAQNTDKKIRLEAIKAIIGSREQALAEEDDPKKQKALLEEIQQQRKVLTTDFKGQAKDLFLGATMPELKSKNLEDKAVKLSDFKGKVVVLDIWATWCGPCVAMIPHEREMVERLKDKPFALISVSADAKKETLEKFLEKTKMPWTHWWDGGSRDIVNALDVQFFPTIYVLDQKGVIRFKNIRGAKLDKAVDSLLKEAGDSKKGKTE